MEQLEALKELVFGLCSAPGTPGDEYAAAEYAAERLSAYGETEIDRMGNVVCRMGKRGAKERVLLDAHIDQIGMVVTRIDEQGFLHMDKSGGVDRRVLPGGAVTVYGGETLYGVVCCLPPHLTASGAEKVEPVNELCVDVGLTGEEAAKLVSPGDRITFRTRPRSLLGSRVTSSALDDRAGCASLIRCAQLLQGESLSCELVILLSSREETGGQGAQTGAYAVSPTQAIMVDVSFASQPDVPLEKTGKLGGGAMVGFAPILDGRISRRLIELAQREDIPFVREVMGGATGTNGDEVAIARGGVRTGLISIPLRYMHTPAEVIDLCDVESTARLLAAYVREVE